MLKAIIEGSIRARLADIYEKLALTSRGIADLSEKLMDLIDHVSENRKSINVLIEMHTQMMQAVMEEEERSAKRGVPTLMDLLGAPVDDDDMPN